MKRTRSSAKQRMELERALARLIRPSAELAHRLGFCSIDGLYRAVREHRVPALRIDKVILFDPDELRSLPRRA